VPGERERNNEKKKGGGQIGKIVLAFLTIRQEGEESVATGSGVTKRGDGRGRGKRQRGRRNSHILNPSESTRFGPSYGGKGGVLKSGKKKESQGEEGIPFHTKGTKDNRREGKRSATAPEPKDEFSSDCAQERPQMQTKKRGRFSLLGTNLGGKGLT